METKLKFKVGDKVRVKSLEWYNNEKNEKGDIHTDETIDTGILFTPKMSDLCGAILRIIAVDDDHYTMSGVIYYWQDWMLEDEVVTEEKQEDKQLNQNDMKTKEMTLREAQEFLNNKKIMCLSEEETTKVQTKLFKLGINWEDETEENTEVDTSTFLFFIEDKEILQTDNIKDWIEDEAEKIEPSEILAIQIKEEEKPKFNPSTLQDFDKVLVRGEDTNKWRLSFFDTYNPGCFYCIDYCFKQCVPYNDETKHLKGTTDEAPEFYQVWKK